MSAVGGPIQFCGGMLELENHFLNQLKAPVALVISGIGRKLGLIPQLLGSRGRMVLENDIYVKILYRPGKVLLLTIPFKHRLRYKRVYSSNEESIYEIRIDDDNDYFETYIVNNYVFPDTTTLIPPSTPVRRNIPVRPIIVDTEDSPDIGLGIYYVKKNDDEYSVYYGVEDNGKIEFFRILDTNDLAEALIYFFRTYINRVGYDDAERVRDNEKNEILLHTLTGVKFFVSNYSLLIGYLNT